MARYGKTKAGTQRWSCASCKATSTRKNNNDAKILRQFLSWLLSKGVHRDMPGEGRSFRRKTARFWKIWALPPLCDEIHRVVYVDGIYLSRKAVILIARSDEYVLGWYLARSENSRAYEALLSRIAPPTVVVTDGGSGFEKARRRVWKHTRVQRCIFHAFSQIKRYTTTRPKLQAGVELYEIALELLHLDILKEADAWVDKYLKWCTKWEDFLNEKTYGEGKSWEWTHARLVKARNSLNTLVSKHTLFTYLDPILTEDGPLPATNNKLEGGVNAPLRQLIRNHKGMNIEHKIKAVFWWCYLHSEDPLAPAEMLRTLPTDRDIKELCLRHSNTNQDDGPEEWGSGIDWNDFRFSLPYKMDWD